jgi:hypothetical protein
MGKHAQKFREIIELLPKPTDTKGFTPEIAAMCLAQLANKAFHIIQEQEEIIEDLENEVNALQASAIESAPEWKPTKED